MDTFRFVHATNLLLDRPFEGVPRAPQPVAEVLRDASLRAWEALVQLTIDRDAAALLIGGQIYDGPLRGHRAQVFVRQGLERLSVRGIPVFVSLTEDEEAAWDVMQEWPPGVTVFSSPAVRSAALVRSGRHLATVHGCGNLTPDGLARLTDSIRPGQDACLQIVLLSGEPPSGIVQAPPHGVGYCALASRLDWTVSRRDPWVVDPGTTQGRSFAAVEQGPKGAAIVEVGEAGVTAVSFAPLDQVRLLRFDLETPKGATIAALETILEERADEARRENAGVALVVAARFASDAVTGIDAAEKRAALLKRLRARDGGESPLVWWAAIEAASEMTLPHCSNGARRPLASMVLEQSDALLGAALPRSSFLARCFQPLMNACEAEIGLGEIRELVRDSAALTIDLLEEGAPDGPESWDALTSSSVEHAAQVEGGLTVLQIEAAERKASLLASMQKTLFTVIDDGARRLEGDEVRGLVNSAAGQRLALARAASPRSASVPSRAERAEDAPTQAQARNREPNDDCFRSVFLLDAKSVRTSAPGLAAALASRPSPSLATRPQRCIEQALEALDREARRFLTEDGSGRIERIVAAQKVGAERLRNARQEELRRVALLARSVPRTSEVAHARETLADHRRERETLLRLLQISPLWQERQELLAAVAAIAPPDAEQLAGYDALQDKLVAARAAGRALRWRRDRLRIENEGLKPDARLLAAAERVSRLASQVSGYRDDLIILAARRARCQELETALTNGLESLSVAWDRQRLADFDPDAVDAESFDQWSERCDEAAARSTAAADAERDAKDCAESLSREVGQRLEGAPADDESDLDREWRSLWRLRTALDELWVVQSQAEAKARAVQEREEALAKLEPRSRSTPATARVWLGVATALALAALLGLGFLGQFVRATYAGFAALGLLVLDYALGWRRSAANVEQGRRKNDVARLKREIERARLERDAAWTRAAELQEGISADAAALGLPAMPAMDSVDAREQILAQQAAAARASGVADESLSASVLDLLEREERMRGLAAERERAAEEEGAVRRGWEAWRTQAGLPDRLSVSEARAWLAEVRRLRRVATQLGEAAIDLRGIEPRLAVWEGGARFTLAQLGVNIAGDLCGNRLVEEIRSLNTRVSEAEARAQRRSQAEAERGDVEWRLAAADEEITRYESELAALLAKLGVAKGDDVERRRADLHHRDALRSSIERCSQAIEVMLAEARQALASDQGSAIEARLRSASAEGQVDQWRQRARQLETEIGAAEERLAEAIHRRDEATEAWQSLGEEVEVPTLELECAGLAAELESAARWWRLLALGRGMLEEAARELGRTQCRTVLLDASRIFASLTGGRYTAITLDETGRGLALVGSAGRRVRLNGQIDADAAAHLGLSIRLAIARHVSQEAVPCPLVVDDLLLAFGERAKEGVAAELVAFARGQQVFYLTCDPSSWNHLSRLDAGARLIET